MNHVDDASVPVLTPAAAGELERQLFQGDEAKEWSAMQAAGRAAAAAIWADFGEVGGFPATGRMLVLVGKGHNGGDALIAAQAILSRAPGATVAVVFVFGERSLRPLAATAWRELQQCGGDRVYRHSEKTATSGPAPRFDLCLDGIFGFQFRPPLDPRVTALIDHVNALPIRFRAAIDLPSGNHFRADFTYATGSVKAPVLEGENAGRVRYLDLGFFRPAGDSRIGDDASDRVITQEIFAPLRQLRASRSDKRDYGHLFLLGGSRGFPGAILMSVTAAVRSGAGLVTAFVPESFVAGYAAQLPEAMWVGWPETPRGGLSLEGEHLWRERAERAEALVIGPGLGREPETLALVTSLVTSSAVPLVLDADALQPDIVRAGKAPRVITPHAGEFKRIAGDADLRTFARQPGLTVVLKGPVTRLCQGGTIYHSLSGGPVLARGGSGDVLAGMIGTQLAQQPDDPLSAAARAVEWHGRAADLLARARGAVAVRTTELCDFFGAALLES